MLPGIAVDEPIDPHLNPGTRRSEIGESDIGHA
jgi:hypothetical protein